MVSKPRARRGPKKAAELPASELFYDRTTVASLLMVHTRTLDRMIASQEFPARDFAIRNSPRWRASTVKAWIDEQSHKSN